MAQAVAQRSGGEAIYLTNVWVQIWLAQHVVRAADDDDQDTRGFVRRALEVPPVPKLALAGAMETVVQDDGPQVLNDLLCN